jgi:hypothetical protein
MNILPSVAQVVPVRRPAPRCKCIPGGGGLGNMPEIPETQSFDSTDTLEEHMGGGVGLLLALASEHDCLERRYPKSQRLF